MNSTTDTFSFLFDPIGKKEFFAEYWEQQSMHVARDQAERFASLLSVNELEQLLSTQQLHFPTLQLAHSNSGDSAGAIESYFDADNCILPNRVIEQYRNGATVILTAAHHHLPGLASMVRAISSELQLNCQTNVYLTPPSQQGFAPHYDTHDVLVLQVSGSKQFDFYRGGVELPFNTSSFDPEATEIGAAYDSITLRPGDTLYIPRGVLHDAVSAGDSPSLHITLGIYAITVADLLIESIAAVASENSELRKSLPLQLMESGELTDLLRDSVASAQLRANTPEYLHRALATILDEQALGLTPDTTHRLSGAIAKPGLRTEATSLDTLYNVCADQFISIGVSDDRVKLRMPGQIFEFEKRYLAAIRLLDEVDVVRPVDLPNLGEREQLALCDQLRASGLLKPL